MAITGVTGQIWGLFCWELALLLALLLAKSPNLLLNVKFICLHCLAVRIQLGDREQLPSCCPKTIEPLLSARVGTGVNSLDNRKYELLSQNRSE